MNTEVKREGNARKEESQRQDMSYTPKSTLK